MSLSYPLLFAHNTRTHKLSIYRLNILDQTSKKPMRVSVTPINLDLSKTGKASIFPYQHQYGLQEQVITHLGKDWVQVGFNALEVAVFVAHDLGKIRNY